MYIEFVLSPRPTDVNSNFLIWGPWVYQYFYFNKSPLVRGLSFPSSYRDSTFLSIFAVPNNAVFWITSNFTFTPIRFMYSLKLTETAPRASTTTGITMTFRMRQTFAIWSFNNWYFSTFSSYYYYYYYYLYYIGEFTWFLSCKVPNSIIWTPLVSILRMFDCNTDTYI